MAGGVSGTLRGIGAGLYGAAWECRRAAYARGWRRPAAVPARVVSVGNLTVGGTGKTTLTLWLARRARERGLDAGGRLPSVPAGAGRAWGRGAHVPRRARAGAGLRRAAASWSWRGPRRRPGRRLVLVDDGFSHWALARRTDIVLLDAGRPAGRRPPAAGGAAARAGAGAAAGGRGRGVAGAARARSRTRWLERVARLAPGAIAGGGPAPGERGAGAGRRGRRGGRRGAAPDRDREPRGGGGERARGRAAGRTGSGSGATTTGSRAAEAAAALEAARRAGGWVLVTAKDAVRWPEGAARERVAVLEVEWEWVRGGEAVERAGAGGGGGVMETDVLVIGSGVAGLLLALKCADRGADVTVVTKQGADDSSTNWAQGGIAAVFGAGDSFARHERDTLRCGAGLSDPAVVRQVVRGGPRAGARAGVAGRALHPRGARRSSWGARAGTAAAASCTPRTSPACAIEQALLERVRAHPRIRLLEHQLGARPDPRIAHARPPRPRRRGRAAGAPTSWTRGHGGRIRPLGARVTVLATGGCGKVYLYTINPDVATGDGIAMAYRAGAAVENLEFVQFHPTCLYHPRGQVVPDHRGAARRGRGAAHARRRALHAARAPAWPSWRRATWWRAPSTAR